MTPADKPKLSAIVTDVMAYYRQDVSRFTLDLWWNACRPFDLEQVNKRTLYSKGANYESSTDYIQPIQQLDKLTIDIYDERGVRIVTNGPSYLTFRFTCARDNMYKY
jgi:hypothetical protein